MTASKQQTISLKASDLNSHGAVACPNALAGMPNWSAHPKVFLVVSKTGVATCPYCSTTYRLAAGEVLQGAH